jgi:hypothetical protein
MKKPLSSVRYAALLALTYWLTGCSPETVSPPGNPSGTPVQQGDPISGPQGPLCSDSVYARLQDSTGGHLVNFCVSNCPPTPPEWGTVQLVNTWDSLSIRVQMSVGWFIDQADLGFGLGNIPLQISPSSGQPIVGSNWRTTVLQPVNTFTFYFNKADLAKDLNGCFLGAMRIKVSRRTFTGQLVPSSPRYLYLSTDGLTGTTFQRDASGNLISSSAMDPSPYLTPDDNIINWCWQSNCVPKVPGGIFQTNQCLPAPAIPSYTCNATGAGTISATTVRCLDVDGSYGTINCTGPGTLVIPAGRTVSCALSAFSGCTLIVQGTLNWTSTASYNGNMFIYVAPGGVLNRVGSAGSLTTNGTGSILVNSGTMDIDANLISKGKVYNTGSLTTRNMTITGGSAFFSNKGTATIEQNLSVNCGSPSTCSATAESSIRNCGRLDVNTAISSTAGTSIKNHCSLVSKGSFTMAGTFVNQGIAVAGLTGTGNGYINNGTTNFENGSVLVTRNFNWGSNRTITVNGGNAWIIAAQSVLSGNAGAGQPFFTSFGVSGRLNISSTSSLLGSGQLHLLDADPFGPGDVPGSTSAIRTQLSQSPYMLVTTRPVGPTETSIATCTY